MTNHVHRPHALRSALVFLLSLIVILRAEAAEVTVIRVPEGGIQPQTLTDAQGTLHLLYYKGDPRSGDLVYVRQAAGSETFGAPILATSPATRAMAIGTIRGGQFALGKSGRVHVVWNGGDGAEPNHHSGAPLLYTRSTPDGTAFEPARDLITKAVGLDGGASVAADTKGNVYVTWHGKEPGTPEGEAGRAVYIASSDDDGKTFTREIPALAPGTGVCACCGMRAFLDPKGQLLLLFRAAADMTNRAELLVAATPGRTDGRILNSDLWTTPTCPMSSAFFGQGTKGILAAWETAGKAVFASVDPASGRVSPPLIPTDQIKAKFPWAVQNKRGELLLVWTEGTAWEKGGSVAWQVYNPDGKPSGQVKRQPGVPVWSFATAYVKPDGSFVVIF